MEKEECLCDNVLINVNRITVQRCDEEKYIRFSRRLDKLLKMKFGKYYICDQVNQLNKCKRVFYVEAFYRDIKGVYEASIKINEFVEMMYNKEFGECIRRKSITSFRDVKKVHPDCKYYEEIETTKE